MTKPNLFQDVLDFHVKFGLPTGGKKAAILDENTKKFRVDFMREELNEFIEACVEGDVAKAADGLCDLVYVALGTAVMMGVPFDACWAEVHRANMTKVRATDAADPRSTRKNSLDVVKPEGWRPPDIQGVLDAPR